MKLSPETPGSVCGRKSTGCTAGCTRIERDVYVRNKTLHGQDLAIRIERMETA